MLPLSQKSVFFHQKPRPQKQKKASNVLVEGTALRTPAPFVTFQHFDAWARGENAAQRYYFELYWQLTAGSCSSCYTGREDRCLDGFYNCGKNTQTRILCLNVHSKRYLQSIWDGKIRVSLGREGAQQRQSRSLTPAFCHNQPVTVGGTGQNLSKTAKKSLLDKQQESDKSLVCELQLTLSVQVLRIVLEEEEMRRNPPSSSRSKPLAAFSCFKL